MISKDSPSNMSFKRGKGESESFTGLAVRGKPGVGRTAYNTAFTRRSSRWSSLGASPNPLVGHGGCREAETQPPVPASQVRKRPTVI